MSESTDTLGVISGQRVIAIVRSASADHAYDTARTLMRCGVRAIEVSLVTPGALTAIARLREGAPADTVIGVGTALSTRHVHDAAAAGARFVVSPVCDGDVIGATKAAGLVSVPAGATPTEMTAALRYGADLVKVFPASLWSPAAIRDLLASLPDLPLVPTGGISLDAAPGWIEAGARAVGLGSALSRAADGPPATVGVLLDRLHAGR